MYVKVRGIDYHSLPKLNNTCKGCVGYKECDSLCWELPECTRVIWVKGKVDERVGMKGHLVAEFVNRLRDEAVSHKQAGSLREALSKIVHEYVEDY